MPNLRTPRGERKMKELEGKEKERRKKGGIEEEKEERQRERREGGESRRRAMESFNREPRGRIDSGPGSSST